MLEQEYQLLLYIPTNLREGSKKRVQVFWACIPAFCMLEIELGSLTADE